MFSTYFVFMFYHKVISSDSEEELMCICSWIDGYYRLFVDQYTSLQGVLITMNIAIIDLLFHTALGVDWVQQIASHARDSSFTWFSLINWVSYS